MKFHFFALVLLLFFLGCELEGVQQRQQTTTPEKSLGKNNAALDSTQQSDNQQSDKQLILKDSINGKPNEMVFQGKSGLRIEWTKKGIDPIKLNDVVMVNYSVRVIGREPFDSNEKAGTSVPLKTNIGVMVPGWEQGILKMNVGDKGRILIPAKLGYGSKGNGKNVPPNADLIVDLEIVNRIKPRVLDNGIRVFTWFKSKSNALPKKGNKITFDYFAHTAGEKTGMYDNSYKNGKPYTIVYENDNLIEGLHMGLGVLSAGDNAFIEIPSKYAYGKKGLQDMVPPNSDIVYDVRIIRIE